MTIGITTPLYHMKTIRRNFSCKSIDKRIPPGQDDVLIYNIPIIGPIKPIRREVKRPILFDHKQYASPDYLFLDKMVVLHKVLSEYSPLWSYIRVRNAVN
jgi:hypothetical protein